MDQYRDLIAECQELVKKVELEYGPQSIPFRDIEDPDIDCEKYFENWINDQKYDFKKVQIMTALIFLNIAALHHYPYNKLLFYLGKSMLSKYLLK